MMQSRKGKIPKKVLRANEALEKRKARRRLCNKNDLVDITEDMVEESIIASSIDRLASLLPRGHFRKSKIMKQDNWNSKKPWLSLPFVPTKKSISWLPLKEQDSRAAANLTLEIEKFAGYVGVSSLFILFFYLYKFKLSTFLLCNDDHCSCKNTSVYAE